MSDNYLVEESKYEQRLVFWQYDISLTKYCASLFIIIKTIVYIYVCDFYNFISSCVI